MIIANIIQAQLFLESVILKEIKNLLKHPWRKRLWGLGIYDTM